VGRWVRNCEVPRGNWGRRTAASGSTPGVYAGWSAGLNGFGTVSWGTDGGGDGWMPWMVGSRLLATGPDFWFGCSSPPVFDGFLAKRHFFKLPNSILDIWI
jgi:hypothetical protein